MRRSNEAARTIVMHCVLLLSLLVIVVWLILWGMSS